MTDIEPFRPSVPEADLDDLRRRLRDTRWPAAAPRAGWDTGVPLDWLQDVCTHWADTYDWRTSGEARLDAFEQFRTTIDGVAIHFLHVRSPNNDALPIVMTHGWPGSVFEFLDVLGPLSEDFHLVVPSLPGYGFSDQPTEPGWGTARTARAWTELMARLGYRRYGAQGGDWGSMVTTLVGTMDPDHCVGIHLNMAVAGPSGDEPLTDAEQQALADMKRYNDVDSGYMKLQSTRPQTLAYALTDSPAGQAAWILEKFWSWVDHDGDPRSVIPVDRLLDNVSLYWLTRTAGSSARMYHETLMGTEGGSGDVQVPTGVAVFPREIFRPSRRWAQARYPNLVHFTEQPRGGHFAAFEQPGLFADDVRAFFSAVS